MSFAGSNGSRSPYHERAKASSKSPGPSKARNFVVSVPPRTVRPDNAIPRNSGYRNQSPGGSPKKAKLDVREPNTPTKTLEVYKENKSFSHNDPAKHCDSLPSRKNQVATPIKTPRLFSTASTPFSPSKAYSASPKHQKVLFERPPLYNSQVGSTNSGTGESRMSVPGKIEVNIPQLQSCIKKIIQHGETIATPQSPEVSLNSSNVSIGDDTSQNVNLENTSLSPPPQLLKVHCDGIAFTVGAEQPVQKVSSPRPDFLRKEPQCHLDLPQNPDFGPGGAAPGSSVTVILSSPKADIVVISELSEGGAARVDSTSETADRIPLSNHDVLTTSMSCNSVVELVGVKAPTSSECMSQYANRGHYTSIISEELPCPHQESLPAKMSRKVVDSSSEINESAPLSDQDGVAAKRSCDNIGDAQEVTEKASSGFTTAKVCFRAEELTHGRGKSATLLADLQTKGIDFPVELDIEEDEIDNHELSSGSRILMGMVFGSLLLGFVFGILLASGSQGLLPKKWHVNPLASSWQRSSIRKPVLEMSKSIEGLWQDCSTTSSFYPVVDLISIHEAYSHVRTQAYSLVQHIQYDQFRGFADAYVGDYPSLSLSATTGDHLILNKTKSLGGWNHLTGILHHFRTVCGQLCIKVSQMATNISADGVKFWVSWKPEFEEVSTDALLNAGGESTDGVQELLALLVDASNTEGIDSEAEYEDDNMGLKELLQMTTPELVVELGTVDASLLDTLIEGKTLLDTPGMEGFEKDLYSVLMHPVVGETFLNLQEESALDMCSNVVATAEDNLSVFIKADEVHAKPAVDASVARTQLVSKGECKASTIVDEEHLTTDLCTEMGGMATDSSAAGSEMCSNACTFRTDSPQLASFLDENNDIIRDDNVDELLVQELLVEGIDGGDISTSWFVIIAIGSFGVAVAVSLFKWQRASVCTNRETKPSVKEDKHTSTAASDDQRLIPTVTWATKAPVYHNLLTNTGAISSPAYKVLAPGKFGLQEVSYNRAMTPALSAPTALARPASHMLEMPAVSEPTGFYTKPGYISDRTAIQTPLGTYMRSASYLPSESSTSSSGSASEISSSDGSGSDTNSVFESQLSMMPDESRQLGSFIAYEPVAVDEGMGIEQIKLTPVRRSSRIRSQVASPAHFV